MQKNLDENSYKKRIEKKKDLFKRNIQYQKVEIDETFPSYILENKEKFEDWII